MFIIKNVFFDEYFKIKCKKVLQFNRHYDTIIIVNLGKRKSGENPALLFVYGGAAFAGR